MSRCPILMKVHCAIHPSIEFNPSLGHCRNRHPVETILSSISYEDARHICHLETTFLQSSLCSQSIYFCKVNAEFALHVLISNMKSKVERSIFWVACHLSQVGILSSSHFRWMDELFSFLFYFCKLGMTCDIIY